MTTFYKNGIDETTGLCGSCKQFQKDAYARGRGEAAEIAKAKAAEWDKTFNDLRSQHRRDVCSNNIKALAARQVADAILASASGLTYEQRVRAEIAEKVSAVRTFQYPDHTDCIYIIRDEALAAIHQERTRDDILKHRGWEYTHDHQSKLIARDGWMCEKHPGTEWPHGDCAGPGQAWAVEGKEAICALKGTAKP